MTTIDQALAVAAAKLNAAGIAESRLDARILLGAATGLNREALFAHGDRTIDPEAATRLDGYVTRRVEREPVARILGHKEFWSLDFEVTADTLVPRPETETLIEAALAAVPERDAALNVLDLGTGTGCLLLAFLTERPRAHGLGVDINPGAVVVAARNAARLTLEQRARFLVADFTGELSQFAGERFDVILSNPPYIAEGEIDTLTADVAQYDPRAALSGGADGLAAYRALASCLGELLASGGQAFLEIGQGQAEDVAAIMAGGGLAVRADYADLAGITRALAVSPR